MLIAREGEEQKMISVLRNRPEAHPRGSAPTGKSTSMKVGENSNTRNPQTVDPHRTASVVWATFSGAITEVQHAGRKPHAPIGDPHRC